MRWVQRYVPDFEKSWARYARKVGRSWRVDETYLKVQRLRAAFSRYNALDELARTVDVMLTQESNMATLHREAVYTH